jgi:hypothetical protein
MRERVFHEKRERVKKFNSAAKPPPAGRAGQRVYPFTRFAPSESETPKRTA